MEAGEAERHEAFEQGTTVAQIFSGIFFSGVAAWLTISNGTKLAFVHHASLEKRLTVCCFLNTYVGFFSAFFNFFQLTAVDDAVLPSTSNFTMDLARPVEWIMTCPLMQLVLVLMGGAKIPEYRRYLMPMFSVTILALGTAAALQARMWLKVLLYICGCLIFGVMFSFNRLQIIEYSGGEEGIFFGDSEFRKATLLLLGTWSPFPVWYLVSPEGFGFIDNVLIIQIGWAFLNIVAKFIFIFYMQRVKDLYCNRLKTKRELQGNKSTVVQRVHINGSTSPPLDVGEFSPVPGFAPDYEAAVAYEQAEVERKRAQLGAVVVETMTFLGMAQHTDRFLKLLDRAKVTSITQVEALTKETSAELQLPYDLVTALQRRLRVWKLEMVDDAEMGLDKGEEHYIKKALEVPNDVVEPMPGMVQPFMNEFDRQFSPDMMEDVLQKADMRFQDHSKSALEATRRGIVKDMNSHTTSIEIRLTRELQSAVDGKLMPKLEACSKTADIRGEMRAFESRVNAQLSDLTHAAENIKSLVLRLGEQSEQQVSLLSTKTDSVRQRLEHFAQKMDFFEEKVVGCVQKVDTAAKVSEVTSQAQQTRLDSAMAKLREHLEGQLQHVEGHLQDAAARSKADAEEAACRSEAASAKVAADVDAALRKRFEELEDSMVVRSGEEEGNHKRRHEELLRQSAGRRLDDLSTQVQRIADRVEVAVESARTSLEAEMQSCVGRVGGKVDALQSATVRQQTEHEVNLKQQLEQVMENAVSRGAHSGAQIAAQRAEKAVEDLVDAIQRHSAQAVANGTAESGRVVEKALSHLEGSLASRIDIAIRGAAAAGESAVAAQLESSLQKRLDDAVARAALSSAQQGAQLAANRAEKAVEALEDSTRSELSSAMSSLVERLDDQQAAQLRKVTEREERAARRFEEVIEMSSSRQAQKVDDMATELKRELHGFAKRLNAKIHFM